MRKTVLSLMSVATLALVGCNSAPSSSQSSDTGAASSASSDTAAATKVANEVSGTISVRGATPPSATAQLVINLLDVSAEAVGSAPLASKTSPAGAFPQPFQLTFNPTDVKPGHLYVVKASLTDGERQYVMKIQSPVLGKSDKDVGIAIELVAELTPGEKLLAAFTDGQKQLGGMKITPGTKLEATASRSWQVFRQAGQIQFIRELVDYGDKGATSTDYAFKDGKLWAAEQKTMASSGAKPSSIDRAGWSDDGTLVLKQHQVGSDVQTLDDDAAAKLHKQAMDILKLATGGKNK